jgi:hypothetical protein
MSFLAQKREYLSHIVEFNELQLFFKLDFSAESVTYLRCKEILWQ